MTHDVLAALLGLAVALAVRHGMRDAHASSVYCETTEVQHEFVSFENVSGPGDAAQESRWWLDFMLIHPDDLELILSDDQEGDGEMNQGFAIAEADE